MPAVIIVVLLQLAGWAYGLGRQRQHMELARRVEAWLDEIEPLREQEPPVHIPDWEFSQASSKLSLLEEQALRDTRLLPQYFWLLERFHAARI